MTLAQIGIALIALLVIATLGLTFDARGAVDRLALRVTSFVLSACEWAQWGLSAAS